MKGIRTMKRNNVRLLCLILCLCMLSCAVLAGCSRETYTNALTSSEVSMELLAALPDGGKSFLRMEADYISESRFGERYEELLSRCYTSSVILTALDVSVSADQIGVFHANNEADAEIVLEIIEEYVATETRKLSSQYEGYAPDQVSKLDNAQVKICGTYILYTFLSEADTEIVQNAFEEALRIPAS